MHAGTAHCLTGFAPLVHEIESLVVEVADVDVPGPRVDKFARRQPAAS